MTEFLVSQGNQVYVSPDGQPDVADSADQADEREINLREALDWLVGSGQYLDDISEADCDERKERHLDLLMWLMNLELRLSPYQETV